MKDYRKYTDEELDQLFREAHAQEEASPVSYTEDFWSEMEALLPAEEKPRRRLVFWWYAAAGLLLLGGVFVAFSPFGNTLRSSQKVDSLHSSVSGTPPEIKPSNVPLSADNTHRVPFTEKSFSAESRTPVTDLPAFVKRDNMNKSQSEDAQVVTTKPYKRENLFGEEEQALHLHCIAPFFLPGTLQLTPPHQQKEYRFYSQMAFGIGQSYQMDVSGANTGVFSASLGVGIRKEIKQMELSFGLQVRAELLDNLNMHTFYSGTNNSGGTSYFERVQQIKQLYSLEFPLAIGQHIGRHRLLLQITPGIQTFYTGSETLYQDNAAVGRQKTSGTLVHAKTMTMEAGFGYFYALQPRLWLGGSVNADFVRPFSTDYYEGSQHVFPVNAQLSVRRLF